MTPAELQRRRSRAFLSLTEEEFSVAVQLQREHRRQSAYFLQQCVEKLLRGVLEVEGRPAGTSHSIRGLSELLPAEHALKSQFVALDELSSASTRYRYP